MGETILIQPTPPSSEASMIIRLGNLPPLTLLLLTACGDGPTPPPPPPPPPPPAAKLAFVVQPAVTETGAQLSPGPQVAIQDALGNTVMAGTFGYGFKWWLVPYGAANDRWAWTMLGYGGQRTVVIPALDIVATFTGWNIDEHPSLPVKDMVDRLVAAAR